MSLVVLHTERSQCKKSVIETLKDAMEEAEAGQIIAVGIAVVRPEGTTNTSHSQTDDAQRLLSAITLLEYRLVKSLDGTSPKL